MPERDRPIIVLLRDRFDARPFRVSEAVDAGVSRTTLHRLRERGELGTSGRGILQLPDAGMGMLSGLAVVSAKAPDGTICLNSALAYWDLTDEIPARVHVAVPRGAHRPVIKEPPTRVHVFNTATFQLERQQARSDADEPFWIYSAERSVVDAMRMSRWVGRDVALHALGRYMSRPGSSPARLAELARELGGGAQLRPALETLLSLIDQPAIRLQAYPLALNLAAKIVTAMQRRETSTRDRDFADLWVTSRLHRVDAAELVEHVQAVASHRHQPIIAMAEALANMPDRQQPYAAMVTRMSYLSPPPELWLELIDGVIAFVDPILSNDNGRFSHWDPEQLLWR